MESNNKTDVETPLSQYLSLLIKDITKLIPFPEKIIHDKISKIFPCWIFSANIAGKLDDNLIPTDNIINHVDFEFYFGPQKPISIIIPPKLITAKWVPDKIVQQINNSEFYKNLLNLKLNKVKFFDFNFGTIQWNRIKYIYTGEQDEFCEHLYHTANIYRFFGLFNYDLSMPRELISELKALSTHRQKKCTKEAENLVNLFTPKYEFFDDSSLKKSKYYKSRAQMMPINITELFGSPFNTKYKYCSAFEIDKIYFSSEGSFHKMKPENFGGNYHLLLVNPPFNEVMLLAASRFVLDLLDKRPNTGVLLSYPVWDSESQRIIGARDYCLNFEAYEILRDSKYMKMRELCNSQHALFYNYNKNEFIRCCNAHIMLMTNFDIGSPLDTDIIDPITKIKINPDDNFLISCWYKATFKK